MKRSYDEVYLDSAQNVLGHAFDWVANTCEEDPQKFAEHFASSQPGKLFERGHFHYVAGMNGAELVNAVMEDLGEPPYPQPHEFWLDKSPEYWAGWVLAFYQWYRNTTFEKVLEKVSCGDLLRLYPMGHEQDILNVTAAIDRLTGMES